GVSAVVCVCVCVCVISHLADVVDDHVALIAQDGGGVHILLSEHVEPQRHTIHHGQEQYPQEPQDVQDPLYHVTSTPYTHTHTHTHTHTPTHTHTHTHTHTTSHRHIRHINGKYIHQENSMTTSLPAWPLKGNPYTGSALSK